MVHRVYRYINRSNSEGSLLEEVLLGEAAFGLEEPASGAVHGVLRTLRHRCLRFGELDGHLGWILCRSLRISVCAIGASALETRKNTLGQTADSPADYTQTANHYKY